MYGFRLRFHWNLFLGGLIDNIPSIIGSDDGFASAWQQAIVWTNDAYTDRQ